MLKPHPRHCVSYATSKKANSTQNESVHVLESGNHNISWVEPSMKQRIWHGNHGAGSALSACCCYFYSLSARWCWRYCFPTFAAVALSSGSLRLSLSCYDQGDWHMHTAPATGATWSLSWRKNWKKQIATKRSNREPPVGIAVTRIPSGRLQRR